MLDGLKMLETFECARFRLDEHSSRNGRSMEQGVIWQPLMKAQSPCPELEASKV